MPKKEWSLTVAFEREDRKRKRFTFGKESQQRTKVRNMTMSPAASKTLTDVDNKINGAKTLHGTPKEALPSDADVANGNKTLLEPNYFAPDAHTFNVTKETSKMSRLQPTIPHILIAQRSNLFSNWQQHYNN